MKGSFSPERAYFCSMFRLFRFLVSDFILLVAVISCCLFSDMVIYGISQGKGQLNIVLHVRQVEEVMKDPLFPDSLKQKLNLIKAVKQFAYDSLGLRPSKNYTTIYDQHGRPVLWTITASEPFLLRPKEWTFPFLGKVSYKGFFNYEKGKREAMALASQGYDVDYGGVSGWSTLGWFKDPILSNMLSRDEGHIADLIIHELTHGTIYRKNSVDFNENLANFIGDKGTERFVKCKYGIASREYKEYVYSKADRKVYNEYILEAAARLDSLYRSFPVGDNLIQKESKKMSLIYAIIDGVGKLSLHHKNSYLAYTREAIDEKNAFFMSFRRYDSKYDEFERTYSGSYKSDLRLFIKAMAAEK
jgi:predicted aminopeptidase